MAGYDAGSVVVSPRGVGVGFCRVMGTLPADIRAASNVKVYGYHINGEYVMIECVLTCLTGRRCWSGAVV